MRTESGYTLDAVVTLEGRQVAVESDGPADFVSRRPDGKTQLKRRQLHTLEDWLLLSVSTSEWPASAVEQQAFLRRRLDALLKRVDAPHSQP